MEGGWEDRRIPIEGGANQRGHDEGIEEVEQQHPLLMPTVMSVLFQQMSKDELAKCRQVCWEWFNGSLSTWRSKSTMNLTNGSRWSRHGSKEERKYSVGEFHRFWEEEENKCTDKPFARFRIFYSDIHPNSEYNLYFWGRVGVSITHLTLQRCRLTSANQFREMIYVACPNLQHLAIKCCHVTYSDYKSASKSPSEPYNSPEFGERTQLKSLTLSIARFGHLPDSWLNLLSHFTALDNITILSREWCHQPILEAVKLIRMRDPSKLPLKQYGASLILCTDYYGEVAPTPMSHGSDLLRQLGIPLASIIIVLDDSMDRDVVKRMLKFHAETITYMHFQNGERNQSFQFQSGLQFPNLQRLRIRGSIFQNLHFLQSTPNITDLQISYYEEETTHFQSHYLFANSVDLLESDLRLTRLSNLDVDFTVSEENLRCLANWIPNVEKFQMTLNIPQIQIACGRCQQLSQLGPHPFQPENEEVKEFRLATLRDRI